MENKDRKIIKQLVQSLECVLDYASGMKTATAYCPASAPNLRKIDDLVKRVNEDYKIKKIVMGVNIYEEKEG